MEKTKRRGWEDAVQKKRQGQEHAGEEAEGQEEAAWYRKGEARWRATRA